MQIMLGSVANHIAKYFCFTPKGWICGNKVYNYDKKRGGVGVGG